MVSVTAALKLALEDKDVADSALNDADAALKQAGPAVDVLKGQINGLKEMLEEDAEEDAGEDENEL
eukprot:1461161-Pyramimonas_sp.AAC.1